MSSSGHRIYIPRPDTSPAGCGDPQCDGHCETCADAAAWRAQN